MEKIAIMVSRHSAFYSPLIGTIAGEFLAQEGLEATYATLQPGQRSRHLLASGEVDVMQSAVGSNWGPMAAGETNLPRHFAQINRRDGFFLAARDPAEPFDWKQLEGRNLIADHGGQPMLMLRYATAQQGVDWSKINVIDAGGVDAMDAAFREGQGDFVHQQGPAPQQLEIDSAAQVVASVGAAMPAVAFSSLAATSEFLQSDRALAFTRAYRKSCEWARTADVEEVAFAEKPFFPEIGQHALEAAIRAYRELGCWEGDIEIPRDLYQQALEVFLRGDAIRERFAYEDVVSPPPT